MARSVAVGVKICLRTSDPEFFEIFGLIRVLEPGFSVATELEFAEFVEAFLV